MEEPTGGNLSVQIPSDCVRTKAAKQRNRIEDFLTVLCFTGENSFFLSQAVTTGLKDINEEGYLHVFFLFCKASAI